MQSKFEEAEAVLKAVLQVRASGADRDGLGMVRSLHEYGFLLSQQGLHEKAAAKYQEALSILQRNHASQLNYVFKPRSAWRNHSLILIGRTGHSNLYRHNSFQ